MGEKDYFRVLVAISLHTAAGREKFNGINRFLGQGHAWDIELLRNDDELTPERLKAELRKGYDGLLIFMPKAKEIFETVRTGDLPVVFTDYPTDAMLRALPRGVFILDNVAEVIRAAVGHLLGCRGIASLGFVPTRTPMRWSNERRNAFRAETSRHGVRAEVFSGDGDDLKSLASWIAALPKPTGVIAAYDDRGHDVLEAARRAGFRIPDEVSVLGIGNDKPVCETTLPPLSSVAIDFSAEGYRAARELQAMMLRRTKPRLHKILIGTRGIERRASTSAPADNAALVRRALEFIDEHALEGIEVGDVVAHIRVSRRLADLRFREITGQTILNAILSRRMDEAKRLLGTTDRRITDIALQCGYANANSFKNVFRRLTGVSPRDWRKRNASFVTAPNYTKLSDRQNVPRSPISKVRGSPTKHS